LSNAIHLVVSTAIFAVLLTIVAFAPALAGNGDGQTPSGQQYCIETGHNDNPPPGNGKGHENHCHL
jgi:hypothetical protein